MWKKGMSALVVLSLSYIGTTNAADTRVSQKKRLDADKMQVIQNISRNVLTAKHNETANSELAPLRQRVEELRQAVDKLHMSFTAVDAALIGPTNITLTVDDKGKDKDKDNKLAGSGSDKVLEKREGLKNDLKGALNRVRSQRAKFESAAESRPSHRRELETKAAAKVKELEDDLDNVLQAPQDAQAAKLAALSERLKIRKGNTYRKLDDTPTISSIVRHRD